jgi:glycosyltransferase involved in cell wall biosynthesis
MLRLARSVSVVICAYSDERRIQLQAALDSVLRQSVKPFEVLAVIDHNDKLRDEIAAAYPHIRVVANTRNKGLSGARNTGLEVVRGDIVAFLDDDAIADVDWLKHMLNLYEDESVIGSGGHVTPLWPARRPSWLPEEFDWVVGCSYRGQPESVAAIRNPIGCNMSFQRELHVAIGGFREGIGRTANDAAGCEETEFFIRAHQAFPDRKVLYDPSIKVQHQISPERTTWSYFCKRCLAEGRSKTMMVDRVGSGRGLASERSYVVRVLPRGVLRGLKDTILGRNLWGAAKAAGIVAGLALTAWGYSSARWLAAES